VNVQRIESGTSDGDALGFFDSLFSGWLELRDDRQLYLHFIISRNKNSGNTQALIRQWLAQGYDVRVVMPRPIMQHILKKMDFIPSMESIPEWYEDIIECWRRPKEWLLPGSSSHPQNLEDDKKVYPLKSR